MTTSPTPPAPTTTFVHPETDAATRARVDQAVAWIEARAEALAAEAPTDPSRRWERRFIAETGAAPDDETRAERAMNERIAAELNRAFPTAVAAMMWVTADEVGLLRGTDDSLFTPKYLASNRIDILARACDRHDARAEKLAAQAEAAAARDAEWRKAEVARANARAEAKAAKETKRAARAEAKANKREARAETKAAKRAARIETQETKAATREARKVRRTAAKEAGRAARHAERMELVAGAKGAWSALTAFVNSGVSTIREAVAAGVEKLTALSRRRRDAQFDQQVLALIDELGQTPTPGVNPRDLPYGWRRPEREPAPDLDADPDVIDAEPIVSDAEPLDLEPPTAPRDEVDAPSTPTAPGLLRRPPSVDPTRSGFTDVQFEAVLRMQAAVIADFGVAVTDDDTTQFIPADARPALLADERLVSPAALEAMAASVRDGLVAEVPPFAQEAVRDDIGRLSNANLVAVALQSLGLQQETKQVVVLRPIGR